MFNRVLRVGVPIGEREIDRIPSMIKSNLDVILDSLNIEHSRVTNLERAVKKINDVTKYFRIQKNDFIIVEGLPLLFNKNSNDYDVENGLKVISYSKYVKIPSMAFLNGEKEIVKRLAREKASAYAEVSEIDKMPELYRRVRDFLRPKL